MPCLLVCIRLFNSLTWITLHFILAPLCCVTQFSIVELFVASIRAARRSNLWVWIVSSTSLFGRFFMSSQTEPAWFCVSLVAYTTGLHRLTIVFSCFKLYGKNPPLYTFIVFGLICSQIMVCYNFSSINYVLQSL